MTTLLTAAAYDRLDVIVIVPEVSMASDLLFSRARPNYHNAAICYLSVPQVVASCMSLPRS